MCFGLFGFWAKIKGTSRWGIAFCGPYCFWASFIRIWLSFVLACFSFWLKLALTCLTFGIVVDFEH